ncbi:MAG TPA: hypothetical protein VN541_21825, partial [Tepidisphaeraceae bacterium]|nr:hypothetical protein [Tepidisphaeraceae bacterium]
DPTLWAFVALANYAFIRLHFASEQSNSRDARTSRAWSSHLFFAATALGLLTKGPIALVWCFLPVICAMLLRQWTGIRQLRWISGLLIAIALVAPWTILFVARNAAGLRAQLLDPNSTQSYAYFSRPVSTLRQFLGAGPQLAGNFLVWLPAIIAAILSALGDRLLGTPAPTQPARWRRFFVLWVVLLVVLYAAFYKQSVRYMFPIAGPASILLADALDRLLNRSDHRRDNAIMLCISGLVALLLGIVVLEIIRDSPGINTHWLWPHVLILSATGLILTIGCAARTVQRAMPAILAGCVFLCMGFLPQALRPLSDDGPETLAPLLQRTLAPSDPLLCYRISPRVLVFEARRTQIDLQSFPAFLKRLESAKACFICEDDWRQVPQDRRSKFREIGRCATFRSPIVVTPDLSQNRQTALLLFRG